MKRTMVFTVLVIIIAIGWVKISQDAEEQASARRAQEAKAEAARIAAMTPEQKKKQVAAKAKAAAEQKREQLGIQRATAGARLLKKNANNPDSFRLETVLVIDKTNAVCYEFRATNAFGALMRGQAVLAADGKRFLTNTDTGFSQLWRSECENQYGQNVATAIRWTAL